MQINRIRKFKPNRGQLPIAAFGVVVLLVIVAGVHLLFSSHAQNIQISTATPICGLRQLSDISTALNTTPVPTLFSNVPGTNSPIISKQQIAEPGGGNAMFAFLPGNSSRPDEFYFEQYTPTATTPGAYFEIYNATNNTEINHFMIPLSSTNAITNKISEFAVDSSGNIYFDTEQILSPTAQPSSTFNQSTLYKYTPPAVSGGTPTFDWNKQINSVGYNIYALYGYTNKSNGNYYIGVVTSDNNREPAGTTLFDTNGNIVGSTAVVGTYVHQESNGD